MEEDATHLVLDLFVRPIGVPAAKVSRFVPTGRPIQAVRRPPALFRRHVTEDRDLFGTGLFVG
jgi:hypothetical protein